jgi:class 3 adenylate cyclase
MTSLPSGTVTFLFTDIEGSTRLLQEHEDRYGEILADHRRLLREHLGAAGGTEIDTQGDAFFFSFGRARDAVAAAVDAQRALAEHLWPGGAEVRVRMGLHTGEPSVGDEGYLGLDVVRAARICSAARGGQVLISETTRALLGSNIPAGVGLRDLGEQQLKDVEPEHLFQLVLDEAPPSTPALRGAAARRGRADELASSWESKLGARIEDMVERQLEAAFAGERPGTRLNAIGGMVVFGMLTLVVLAVIAVVIVLVVKLAS